MRGIHRSPVNSLHKGQWHGALMFSLISALNTWLCKQSWVWWFEMPLHSLWRHCNDLLFLWVVPLPLGTCWFIAKSYMQDLGQEFAYIMVIGMAEHGLYFALLGDTLYTAGLVITDKLLCVSCEYFIVMWICYNVTMYCTRCWSWLLCMKWIIHSKYIILMCLKLHTYSGCFGNVDAIFTHSNIWIYKIKCDATLKSILSCNLCYCDVMDILRPSDTYMRQ